MLYSESGNEKHRAKREGESIDSRKTIYVMMDKTIACHPIVCKDKDWHCRLVLRRMSAICMSNFDSWTYPISSQKILQTWTKSQASFPVIFLRAHCALDVRHHSLVIVKINNEFTKPGVLLERLNASLCLPYSIT